MLLVKIQEVCCACYAHGGLGVEAVEQVGEELAFELRRAAAELADVREEGLAIVFYSEVAAPMQGRPGFRRSREIRGSASHAIVRILD